MSIASTARAVRPGPRPPAAALAACDPLAGPLPLESQLCFALYSTSLAMTRLYKPLLAPLGLTYPQYAVMLVLWECDGATVGELGERLFLDSGTLTPLLKRLEALGLIERRRNTDDERRVHAHLTAAGRRLRQKAATITPRLLKAMGCSAVQSQQLTRQIQQLRERLAA